jgi:hypothetical protein
MISKQLDQVKSVEAYNIDKYVQILENMVSLKQSYALITKRDFDTAFQKHALVQLELLGAMGIGFAKLLENSSRLMKVGMKDEASMADK